MTTSTATRYETDFCGWIDDQAQLLRSGKFAQLDIDNLVEEIETMGRSEKRSLESHLAVLLMHLLKWQYQPDYRSRSWMLTIQEQRIQVRNIIRDSRSLKHTLSQQHRQGVGAGTSKGGKRDPHSPVYVSSALPLVV